jgi:pre-mRNA-splicing factor CWC22
MSLPCLSFSSLSLPRMLDLQACFDEMFAKQYTMIHRLETNKLRNVAKLFAHLIHSDAIPWGIMVRAPP